LKYFFPLQVMAGGSSLVERMLKKTRLPSMKPIAGF